MKRVFRRKKNQRTDGDEDYYHFLEGFMLKDPINKGDLLLYKEDYKITIIIEKDVKTNTRRQPSSGVALGKFKSKPIIHKVFNSGELIKKEGATSVLIKKPRYLCNQAVNTTKSKSSHQWKKVTCKNCLQRYNK